MRKPVKLYTRPTPTGDVAVDERNTARWAQAEADRAAGRPNIDLHNPRPSYIRSLLLEANVSQRSAARRLGIDERTMRYYCEEHPDRPGCPYPVQFCLEALVPRRQPPTPDLPD
jgi:hypothetical protein